MKFLPALVLAAALAGGVRADEPVGKGTLPPDLQAVPADALGFVHVRAADVWKSEALKDLRETVLKAGAEALQGFDKRFVPHPSTIERLTLVVIPRDENLDREPAFVAILATNKPVEKEAFLKSALPGAAAKKAANGTYYVPERGKIAVAFLKGDLMAFGPPEDVALYLGREPKADGPLAPALRLAAGKRHLVAALNATLLPAKALEGAPPPIRPLLKAKVATLALDISPDVKLDVALHFADADQAKEAEGAVKALAALGREKLKEGRTELLAKVLGDGKVAPLDELPTSAAALFALGALTRLDEFLADPPLKRDGNDLTVSVVMPGSSGLLGMSAVGVGLMLPAVQKVRDAAGRAQSQNNLKQIGLAMHTYHDANGALPPAAICDKKGKPLLSWRVAILPYIEQQNLYQQFKLDEPWDSEHNLKLSNIRVKVYLDPRSPPESLEKGLTYYRLFYGNGAMFDLVRGTKFAQVTDGLSNTFMVVEAAEGVPWTKPDDFEYDPKKPLPKFGTFTSGGFNALFGDGSVRFISNSIPEKTLRALITANGGEVIEDLP
jgi:prepilin-type processing-associated H-X9-DG protein